MAPQPNTSITSIELATNEICKQDIKDESKYNPKVDPCHPEYDSKFVDTTKIIPNYGSKYQKNIYMIVSYILNWIPFVIVMDCVIGIFWFANDRYYTNQWGVLKSLWLNQPSFFVEIFVYYIILVLILSITLKHMISKFYYTNQFLTQNAINKPDTVAQIHKLYPTTTRIIKSDGSKNINNTNNTNNKNNRSNVLIIGTSHLSDASGKQVRQLIDILGEKVKSVVLELDESRYLRMRAGDQNPTLYQATLARDLFRISTYLDPITLFARIGTNLTSYFVEPGMEFRQAANVAIEKNIDIVYGDQELEKTVASIGKNTPKWLALLLNIFIAVSYGFPVVSAFAHLSFVFMHDSWINFCTKLFVAGIVWNAIYYPIYLLIRIFTEQSKLGNGMKRISTLLAFVSKILPCVAKVFKKSDFKTVRDETLANRTLKAAKQFDNQSIVVAVVGLAHMNDMAEIISSQV